MAQPTGTLMNSGDVVQAPAGASCLLAFDQVQAGGPVVYEGSLDGSTFPYSLTAYPLGGGAGETGRTLAAGQSAALVLDTLGLALVRVRATGAVGGAQVWIVPTTVPFPGSGGGGGAGSVLGQVQGTDGTTARTLKTDQAGNLGIAGQTSYSDGATSTPIGISVVGGAALARPMAVAPELFDGVGLYRQRTPLQFKNLPAVAVTAGTPNAAWTPAAGKKFRLMGWMLSLSVAGSVVFKDGGVEFMRTCLMPAGDGKPSPPMANGYLSSAANNVLGVDVSATGAVSGFCYGLEE
jgi:hypothetical protein